MIGPQAVLRACLILGALLFACRKDEPPPVAVPVQERAPVPWSWHKLGGLLVVVGEVSEPTDLHLKGRYFNDHMHAEYGPVRWELYAPPSNEVAELRTSNGKLLAKWSFATPIPETPKPLPAKTATKPMVPVVIASSAGADTAWPNASYPLFKASPVASTEPTPEAVKPVRGSANPAHRPVSPLHRPANPMPRVPSSLESSKEWPGSGEALNLIRGPRGSHWVCLTFDGGSTAEVALDVLDALRERRIRTTFFLTGGFIQRFPDLVRRMDREGHEIGNHTMDHPHLAPGYRRDPAWTKERFQQQLLLADAAFLQLMGRPMDPYWRAPYGEHTPEIRRWAEELGYRHVGWSEGADTMDWATTKERKFYRTGNVILDRLYERMKRRDGDGLIVLMHLGSGRPESDRPAKALGPFLDQALDEGWNFVNVSAYLKEAGKPTWDSSNRITMLAQTAKRR